MKIYHNPRCSKSRETLQILNDNDQNPEIILYLENLPSKAELKSILKKLEIPAEKLIRKSEPIFKEKYKNKNLSEDQWIDAMLRYPKLIERPIVIEGNKAVLGRPPENVLTLI